MAYVKADDVAGVTLVLEGVDKEIIYSLQPGESGVFACLAPVLRVIEGRLEYMPLDLNAMCKLQAFLDTSLELSGYSDVQECEPARDFGFEPLCLRDGLSNKQLEIWMIQHFLMKSAGMKEIAALLRGAECYWLVKFLIQQTDATESLQSLSQRYGLSVSHFRRLSRKALGNTTKTELKSWRLIRALLDNMGERSNLTDLAVKHGYSSLSHFSCDVKNMFKVSPRALRNIITNEVKK